MPFGGSLRPNMGDTRYVVPVYNGCVDLRPIWFTEAGYKFLKDSGAWMFCDEKELDRIVESAKDAGIVITREAVPAGTSLQLPQPKHGLLNFVHLRFRKAKWEKKEGLLDLIVNSGNPDALKAIKSLIDNTWTMTFAYRDLKLNVYRLSSLEGVPRGTSPEYDAPYCEYKIDLERIISSIGRIKTEQALEVLLSLLDSQWGFKRGVYFYANMVGEYYMMKSDYAEPIVMSWIIRAIDKEYLVKLFYQGSKMPERAAMTLRRVLERVPLYDTRDFDHAPEVSSITTMIREAGKLLPFYNETYSTLDTFYDHLIGKIESAENLRNDDKESLKGEILQTRQIRS